MNQDRWAGMAYQLIEDVSSMFGDAVEEVVPAEARKHLMRAQRELLLAMATTLEHHGGSGTRTSRKSAAKPAARRRPSRVDVD
jgi:hypothetical protein